MPKGPILYLHTADNLLNKIYFTKPNPQQKELSLTSNDPQATEWLNSINLKSKTYEQRFAYIYIKEAIIQSESVSQYLISIAVYYIFGSKTS